MAFFKQFPKIDYDVTNIGETQKFVDFFRLVDVNDVLSESAAEYIKYNIVDGARPDIVSQLLYGTPDYYWTFFILNDHLKDGYSKWPKGELAFQKFLDKKYDPYVYCFVPNTFQTQADLSVKQGGLSGFPLNEFLSIRNKNTEVPKRDYQYTIPERGFFKEYIEDTYHAVILKTNIDDFRGLDSTGGNTVSLSYPEFINPYNAFSKEYAETEAIKTAWLKSYYEWFLTTPYGITYETAVRNNLYQTGQTNNDFYKIFYNYVNQNAIMNSGSGIVSEAKNAPHHFTDLNGNRISGYEALYPNSNDNFSLGAYSTGQYVTNYEYERVLNEDAAQIKVLRPDRVESFAKRFKELLNE